MISLKYDYFFKYLMTNETVRKHFISDTLGISTEQIKSLRLSNPFLWKAYRKQKQGILDVVLILNNNSKINIELQIKVLKYWDKRCLFYLGKMFTEDLRIGEQYTKLKKCINISILDFNLDERPTYHHVYHLRDEEGHPFSDLLEIHIIELGKKLTGTGQMDDWIRLFNAKTEEELDMIHTKNAGILEAIREIKHLSLSKGLRTIYEDHMKIIRDRNAHDDYVRDEGITIGETRGKAQGETQKLVSQVRKKMAKGIPAAEIADILEEDSELILKIYHSLQLHPSWQNEKIAESIRKSV